MKKSLVCKHLVIFGCIIALIVGATTGLQIASMNNIRNTAVIIYLETEQQLRTWKVQRR